MLLKIRAKKRGQSINFFSYNTTSFYVMIDAEWEDRSTLLPVYIIMGNLYNSKMTDHGTQVEYHIIFHLSSLYMT